MMKRWLPSPITSGALFAVWLLLNQSIEPAQILLAAILAIGIPKLTRSLQPLDAPRLKNMPALIRLASMSLVEIVRSCFNVGRIILFANPTEVKSQFIKVPLDMHSPYGLAVLSCLINCTPGTVWVELIPETHELVLHVFDLHDEQWWIDTIKGHYESPLIEIFE